MPPLIATPIAVSQDKEHELDQEFELDIRISSVSVPTVGVPNTQNQLTCICPVSATNCTCNTCHIVGTRCIHG
ncbi:MAG TPA: hypothetical protein VFN35_29295 [Ktedonobacteraceae bacterium]|nr:hypothetical protein [Ktedonobacteraceae bacterium]